MRDPFFIAPIPWLTDWAQPWCDRLSLPSLPLHIHEVLAAALLYSVIFYPLSPLLSNLLAPRHYAKLPRKKRLNWDAHVVSMVQSTLINVLAVWVMLVDDERRNMDWGERIWGYTGAAGMIQALAAGYFLWDLVVTSRNLDVFGLGTLAHAVAALLVFSLGFRPFVNYYGCVFVLWELSTPFLNIHWFMDKVDMTGSRAQLYNGFLLLFTFFSCRLVYGTYQSVRAFRDIWAAVNTRPGLGSHKSAVMAFATGESTVPMWLAAVYLVSNLTLNSLNFYWFFMMIRAVRKRFVPGSEPQKQPLTEVEVDLSTIATGVAAGCTPQRRKASNVPAAATLRAASVPPAGALGYSPNKGRRSGVAPTLVGQPTAQARQQVKQGSTRPALDVLRHVAVEAAGAAAFAVLPADSASSGIPSIAPASWT